MGFAPVKDIVQVPQAIIKKHEWCNSNYEKPVLLLERSK